MDTKRSGRGLRFRDYEHVLRMAGLFVLAVVAFLVWRSWMVPRDFGVYGHFRAGAIADAAVRTPLYAGQASCIECHGDVQQVRSSGRHAAIGCEACHGPLGQHARGQSDVAPVRPDPRIVCLTCHTARLGMPAAFPRIVVKEHSESGSCTECHKAHAPGLQ
ncbi:MAG: cytochrome C [Vicinamibacteria bacterium]|nr:cytochrome C [Vicinamibacteria bacterium]